MATESAAISTPPPVKRQPSTSSGGEKRHGRTNGNTIGNLNSARDNSSPASSSLWARNAAYTSETMSSARIESWACIKVMATGLQAKQQAAPRRWPTHLNACMTAQGRKRLPPTLGNLQNSIPRKQRQTASAPTAKTGEAHKVDD